MRYAVILAGGGGTRLWPASRKMAPKQFLALGKRPGEPLLTATVRRLDTIVPISQTLVVTAAEQAPALFHVVPQLPASNVFAEPEKKNTAAAIGLAALHLEARDPNAVLAVLPSDHHVSDEAEFRDCVERAFALAETKDAIVTVGIKPTRAETGFGYLERGDEIHPGVFAVARFVEKPDEETAKTYLASGKHRWNGGMFFFRASRIREEIAKHLPETAAILSEIAEAMRDSGPGAAEAATARVYPHLPSVSIDYGVMEKTGGILTIDGDFGWNDVGAWPALADVRDADADGNVTEGLVVSQDAHNNIVMADARGLVTLIGVDSLVVIKTKDSVLVVPRDRAQDVRKLVDELKERKLDRFL